MTDCITYEAIKETVKSTTKHVVSKVIVLAEMEWCKLSSLQEDIDFMRDELRSMRALLAKLGGDGDGDGNDDGDGGKDSDGDGDYCGEDDDGDGDGRHLDVQVREWRDEVSRLAADIEACVDDYTRRVEDSGARKGFFRRNTRRVASVGARHTISNRIKKLKALIHDISERRRRYNLA